MGVNHGAEAQNRTGDTRIFSPLLYRLSYLGNLRSKRITEWLYAGLYSLFVLCKYLILLHLTPAHSLRLSLIRSTLYFVKGKRSTTCRHMQIGMPCKAKTRSGNDGKIPSRTKLEKSVVYDPKNGVPIFWMPPMLRTPIPLTERCYWHTLDAWAMYGFDVNRTSLKSRILNKEYRIWK